VLPDGKTIIGVDSSDLKRLTCEDITDKGSESWTQIPCKGENIYAIYYEEVLRNLFVGDSSGVIVHFKQNGGLDWNKVHNYGDLRIGSILSMGLVRGLLVFGGDKFKIRAINIVDKKILKGTLHTAIRSILSLQTCELEDNHVQLSVSGWDPNYSNLWTDIFRVKTENEMLKKLSSPSPQLGIEEQMKQIVYLEKKVSLLESQLKEALGLVEVKEERVETLEREVFKFQSQKAKMTSELQKLEKELNSFRVKYKPIKDDQIQMLREFDGVNEIEVEIMKELI
jgi:hypothetical protein